jgi:hypothetical protein
LLALYVAVLLLCFALPVWYYFRMRADEVRQRDERSGRRRRSRRRRRRRRRRWWMFWRRRGNGEDGEGGEGDENEDEDSSSFDDGDNGARLRAAIERSQLETRAVRRKYAEERRARILQLLAPVQLVRRRDVCARALDGLTVSPVFSDLATPPLLLALVDPDRRAPGATAWH